MLASRARAKNLLHLFSLNFVFFWGFDLVSGGAANQRRGNERQGVVVNRGELLVWDGVR